MGLSQMQAMYLLGKNLEWRADGIYDGAEDGLIRDPVNFNVINWYVDRATLLLGWSREITRVG